MATTKETVKKEDKEMKHAPTHAVPHVEHSAGHPTVHKVPATASAHLASKGRYIEAIGRRKTAVARVRIVAGTGKFLVNGKELKDYFDIARQATAALSPVEQMNIRKDYDVTVMVSGGGLNAQSEAIRHGLSRAIVLKDTAWKPRLRAVGFMTRDSRMVERKKYGLRKARRAPQWAKR
jgi:small subunit ribosomal protein S9